MMHRQILRSPAKGDSPDEGGGRQRDPRDQGLEAFLNRYAQKAQGAELVAILYPEHARLNPENKMQLLAQAFKTEMGVLSSLIEKDQGSVRSKDLRQAALGNIRTLADLINRRIGEASLSIPESVVNYLQNGEHPVKSSQAKKDVELAKSSMPSAGDLVDFRQETKQQFAKLGHKDEYTIGRKHYLLGGGFKKIGQLLAVSAFSVPVLFAATGLIAKFWSGAGVVGNITASAGPFLPIVMTGAITWLGCKLAMGVLKYRYSKDIDSPLKKFQRQNAYNKPELLQKLLFGILEKQASLVDLMPQVKRAQEYIKMTFPTHELHNKDQLSDEKQAENMSRSCPELSALLQVYDGDPDTEHQGMQMQARYTFWDALKRAVWSIGDEERGRSMYGDMELAKQVSKSIDAVFDLHRFMINKGNDDRSAYIEKTMKQVYDIRQGLFVDDQNKLDLFEKFIRYKFAGVSLARGAALWGTCLFAGSYFINTFSARFISLNFLEGAAQTIMEPVYRFFL